MDEKKSIFFQICRNTIDSFAMAIIAVSIFGWTRASEAIQGVGMLRLGSEGLAFQSIAQLFAWALVLAIMITLLTSDIFFKKVMLLWRVIALLFLGIVTSAAFAFIFRWFPLDNFEAWAGFLIFFGVGFGGGLFAMVAKVKIEDKRYSKLLSEYKSKEKQED